MFLANRCECAPLAELKGTGKTLSGRVTRSCDAVTIINNSWCCAGLCICKRDGEQGLAFPQMRNFIAQNSHSAWSESSLGAPRNLLALILGCV